MNVIVFGTQDCGYCKRAVQLLEDSNIPYTYKDLYEDEMALFELQAYGVYKTVPQIVVDNWHIGGYTELKEMVDEGRIN